MCNTRGRGAHPYSSDWLNPWLCIPDVSSFVIKSLNRRNYAEFSCCTHCHFISFTSQYEFGHLFVFITASIIVDIDSTRCQTQSFWDLGIYWEDGISSCCRFFFFCCISMMKIHHISEEAKKTSLIQQQTSIKGLNHWYNSGCSWNCGLVLLKHIYFKVQRDVLNITISISFRDGSLHRFDCYTQMQSVGGQMD